jgi:threonine dehydrogenase-like Zn-dependent dehydrogenase
MRALICEGGAAKLVADRAVPEAKAGEALIRLKKAVIGATDLERCTAPTSHPIVLGHQFVGTVDLVKGDDKRSLAGKRVVGTIDTACGACDLCVAGISAHCRQRTTLGLEGRDGCFADYFTLPLANLAVVPAELDDDRAAFAFLVASAVQTARQLTIEGKPYITVLGDGPLGLVMVQVLSRLNASVRLIGRYSEKLALCEKWGVKHRHVDDIGRRADQDVVVDCTGSPAGIELAVKLVRPRGSVVLKSMPAVQPRVAPGVDLTPFVTGEIHLIGSRFGPIMAALGMLEQQEVDVLNIISRRAPINDAANAMRYAAQPGMLSVLLEA